MIWANLIHLSYNMWGDFVPDEYKEDKLPDTTCQDAELWAYWYRSELIFDENTWNILINYMVNARINMVIIDLGDSIIYKNHPEIAVRNAWIPDKLKNELKKIRSFGIEPIPKLNFSTGHDAWLGEYSKMVSTDTYYAICKDLIEEVIMLFDNPRFFHLGMDEEDAANQTKRNYIVVRQHDLWWHDLYFLIGEIEKYNVRPWIWSDYAWNNPDMFFKKMPKSVLQSNWYYYMNFDLNTLEGAYKKFVKLYVDLDANGYDQIPTGSNHFNPYNFERTVEFCKKILDPSRLLGFMNTAWRPTVMPCLKRHKEAIDQIERAINNF